MELLIRKYRVMRTALCGNLCLAGTTKKWLRAPSQIASRFLRNSVLKGLPARALGPYKPFKGSLPQDMSSFWKVLDMGGACKVGKLLLSLLHVHQCRMCIVQVELPPL